MEPRADSADTEPKMNITKFYPVELHCIKALFAHRQYRQCIGACRGALDALASEPIEHPALRAFASFYLALAHDELAHMMHEQSRLKLPTFNQAEIHYQEALKALPTLEVCREAILLAEDEVALREANGMPVSTSSDHSFDSLRSCFIPSSPPVFTNHFREGSLPSKSPQQDRGDSTMSDLSDYSSHDSFDEIMTPNRVLRRDVSRMSLLDQPLKRDYSSMSLLAPQPQLQKSTSQGLLRPIRPGSPPKAYHLPPKLPYVGHTPSRSHIPQLPALRTQESPTRKSRSRLRAEMRMPESQRTSPDVSPLGSASVGSDCSTVSPISIETPVHGDSPEPEPLSMARPLDLSRLNEHLAAMNDQIHTHLILLRRARLTTTIAQAERASRSTRPAVQTVDKTLFGDSNSNDTTTKRLPASKSFWSFTPVDVKAEELQKRIEQGRARGWKKERFRPQKYIELAEKALAEL